MSIFRQRKKQEKTQSQHQSNSDLPRQLFQLELLETSHIVKRHMAADT